jgi:hypothetical protein
MKRLKFESESRLCKKVDHNKSCREGQEEEDLWSTFCKKVDGGPVIKGRGGRGLSERKILQIPISKTIFIPDSRSMHGFRPGLICFGI